MHTENTPVLTINLESVCHVFVDAFIITWQVITTLVLTKMPKTQNSVHDQSRANAFVVNHQDTATP
ncbi:MAG: hypothetical protein ACR2O5_04930, partial [Thiogranum sp.]